MDVLELSKAVSEKVVGWRRALHQIPELGNDLPQTAQYVCDVLDEIGVEYTRGFGLEHAIVAYINKDKPGKRIAIRADMDALPVLEKTGLPYASANGNMHACAHDAHTAGLLGTAYILNQIKDQVNGSVVLLFQPGEEISGGAEPMIKAGCLEGVDRVIGLHVGNVIAGCIPGDFYFSMGSMMACLDKFTIKVNGKGSHGAYPHQSIDPVVIASHIISSCQEIISREKNPVDPGVITFGVFKGGSVYNVIPESVEITGTARAVTHETRKYLADRIGEIAETVAKAYRGSVDYTYFYQAPPLVNNAEVAKELLDSTKKLFPDNIEMMKRPLMGGEDYAYYLMEKPGAYAILANPAPIDGECYAQHNERFDIDDSVLYKGVAMFVQHTLDFLG